MHPNFVKYGLIAAGLMNIGGVLLFSKFFTNVAINNADPVLMSNFGLLMIIVWGLTYLAASTVTSNIKWIAAAFALEKLVYVVCWFKWLAANSLESLYSTDLFAGVFYSIYGLNDIAFLLFFLWVVYSQLNSKEA